MKTRQLVEALRPLTDRVNRKFCWIKTAAGPRRINEPLTDEKIASHVSGRIAYGACPMAPGESTTRLALLDLDDHTGKFGFEKVKACARELLDVAKAHGLNGVPFRSGGGKGIHIFFLWEQPQDAYSVRELLRSVIGDCLFLPGTAGLIGGEIEIFPKQYELASDAYGSMFALPLSGQSELLKL